MSQINSNIPWDKNKVRAALESAFENNSETTLLALLKDNSFLFYELYSRKNGIQPVFREVSFGNEFRCDFAWLNDNSDGPEWVLVEIEKPKLKLFSKKNEPTQQLNHALEQVKSWRRYFDENPNEKRRIFGAVARFRFVLVAGSIENWQTAKASKWRNDHNNNSDIEIRSSDVFNRALVVLEQHPESLWSFAENPTTLQPSDLKDYWSKYKYLDHWRKLI